MAMDLDLDSRQALDLDELLELVAGRARTAPGAAAVRGLEPRCDADWVRGELALVEQTRAHLRDQGSLLPGGIPDPEPALPRNSRHESHEGTLDGRYVDSH